MRLVLALLFAAANLAAAQTFTVRGIAYDSLHNAPLSNAYVAIPQLHRSTTSDANGRFSFDSIAPGAYAFYLQHDVLDEIGMSQLVQQHTVRSANDALTLAVPSFESLWHQHCSGVPPADSAVVFGTVATPAHRPAAGVPISVSWTDLILGSKKTVSQHRRQGIITSDSTGHYVLCGVPMGTGITLHAAKDSLDSGTLDLLPLRVAVQRRDIQLASAGATFGIVTGMVSVEGHDPAGVRVAIEGLPEARTAADGKFVIRNVPVGAHAIEATLVGMAPAIATVDVIAGETTSVDLALTKVVQLAEVKVSAPTVRSRLVKEYEERRRLGSGYFVDSTKISKHPTLGSVIEEVPGAYVRMRGARITSVKLRGCDAFIILDGKQVEQAELNFLDAPDIAAIEVYPSGFNTPLEITARIRNAGTCGSLVIWTKQFIQP